MTAKMYEPPMPTQPSPKHTEVITCIECKAKRWVKPQDKWQVKRCKSCQDAKHKTKNLARLERVKAKVEAKKERIVEATRIPRLYVQKFIWDEKFIPPQFRSKIDFRPRRIWP